MSSLLLERNAKNAAKALKAAEKQVTGHVPMTAGFMELMQICIYQQQQIEALQRALRDLATVERFDNPDFSLRPMEGSSGNL